MTKIAIRFGDNDFHSTWKGVLTSLGENLSYNGEDITKDKKAVVHALNLLAYPCFFIYQHRWDMEDYEHNKEKDLWPNINEKHYTDYLTITEDRVYLNEEVDKYKEENDWDNGETFVLKYNNYLDTYEVYSI